MNRIAWVLVGVTLGLSLVGCETAVLMVSDETISISSSETEEAFSISNGGMATLMWSASADQPWVTLDPDSGTNSGTVRAIVDRFHPTYSISKAARPSPLAAMADRRRLRSM